jgi:hypothetical protein
VSADGQQQRDAVGGGEGADVAHVVEVFGAVATDLVEEGAGGEQRQRAEHQVVQAEQPEDRP